MNQSRQVLISDLAGDLKPVKRPGQTTLPLLFWLIIVGIYSIAIVLITGGLRDNALGALVTAPAYALEILVGTVAIGLLGHAALRTAIPGTGSWLRRAAIPLAAVGVWLALIVFGLLVEPALPPSMLGKREFCFWQTLIFGAPSFAALLWLARGLLPLWPRATAALAGAASAAFPALLMQLACMYAPAHALTHHFAPVAIVAGVGAVLGPLFLRRRAVVPRKRGGAIH